MLIEILVIHSSLLFMMPSTTAFPVWCEYLWLILSNTLQEEDGLSPAYKSGIWAFGYYLGWVICSRSRMVIHKKNTFLPPQFSKLWQDLPAWIAAVQGYLSKPGHLHHDFVERNREIWSTGGTFLLWHWRITAPHLKCRHFPSQVREGCPRSSHPLISPGPGLCCSSLPARFLAREQGEQVSITERSWQRSI